LATEYGIKFMETSAKASINVEEVSMQKNRKRCCCLYNLVKTLGGVWENLKVYKNLYCGQELTLRMVHPFVTAHTFCASQGFLRNLPTNTTIIIFAHFMTKWEKQILARAIRIQKENLGLPSIFQR